METIQELAYLKSYSLRGLIESFNKYNSEGEDIIKREDIVTILKEGDIFFLIYCK